MVATFTVFILVKGVNMLDYIRVEILSFKKKAKWHTVWSVFIWAWGGYGGGP